MMRKMRMRIFCPREINASSGLSSERDLLVYKTRWPDSRNGEVEVERMTCEREVIGWVGMGWEERRERDSVERKGRAVEGVRWMAWNGNVRWNDETR